ncbi:uncharacterized protein BO97DRAFT_419737 [Aspergillus homomorphus CBS 101889]|uniref:Uncharacterized protein n=1 Tax=Aspergillus homomorphus (strain CBS 101889) TaxID=1450537 RepID=A0A395ICG6_ASPHC|nr:hypothetical protein BO97DRAFT_419737 [Aspergillus homomorphus CBS 101889]RAL17499.1 hypothetical protein BO97DRAFT_419737 [Aspergillus homomorphus CBS 101889]
MDTKLQRRSTISVHSPTPSSLRHCYYPSPATSPPKDSLSLSLSHEHSSRRKNTSIPPKPPALARVKGSVAMDSSQMSSEMSWLNDASPMSMTPRTATPRTPQRSRAGTPEPEPTTATLVNPSSALLQDLLKEQRATRTTKGGSDEQKQGNPRTPERSLPQTQPPSQSPAQSQAQSQTQSRTQSWEEVGSDKQRRVHSVASSGTRQPNDMGVREMGEYVSKLNKQNFDLKLEIFHRVQQMTALEKKLQRMEGLEEELGRLRSLEEEVQELREAEAANQRLRDSNEQLRHEIDRRDHAITEAVSMICLLENKVIELQAGEDLSRPSTARPDEEGDAATPKQKSPVRIPERISSRRGTTFLEACQGSTASHLLKRPPSFLDNENKSTAALRSLYTTSEDQSHAAMSEITKSESLQSLTDTLDPASPRLSALSECSELFALGPDGDDGFNRLEIPVIRTEPPANESVLSGLAVSESRDHMRIESWVQPPHDVFVDPISPHDMRSNVSKGPKKTSFDTDSHSSSQKTRVESVFGTSKLPPTPDTMSTAYVPGPSRSNGSIVAEKSRYDQGAALGYRIRRPRSADQLTTRRSSCHSAGSEDLAPNVSDITLPRQSTDGGDVTPSIFPLNCITSRHDRLFNHESLDKPNFGYYGGSALYNEDSLERVLSKIDNSHYQRRPSRSIEELSATLSSSPPLTPQEWVEAAKPTCQDEKEQPDLPHLGPIAFDSGLLVARAPSQASFLGRRHSIDSGFRESDVPRIPTLDLQSLDLGPQPEPDTERRKRISLRPLFGRSGNARRLQTSPFYDQTDSDDGAPAPIIRKTRNVPPNKLSKPNHSLEGHRDFSASMPTYADGMVNEIHRTLPHSRTESSFTTNPALKPSAAGVKDHKRRSSLGIFGWMKGASKKPEPHSPVKHAMPTSGILKDRPTRMAQEFTNHGHEPAKNANMPTVSFALDAKSRGAVRSDEEDPARRPRYMDRRSRRA